MSNQRKKLGFIILGVVVVYRAFRCPLTIKAANTEEMPRCRASLVAQLVQNPPAMWEILVQFLGWEDPMEKEMTIHSSILACRIPGQRSLAGHSP